MSLQTVLNATAVASRSARRTMYANATSPTVNNAKALKAANSTAAAQLGHIAQGLANSREARIAAHDAAFLAIYVERVSTDITPVAAHTAITAQWARMGINVPAFPIWAK